MWMIWGLGFKPNIFFLGFVVHGCLPLGSRFTSYVGTILMILQMMNPSFSVTMVYACR
jgi:hypothetical protein